MSSDNGTSENKESENKKQSFKNDVDSDADWGYDLYPERRKEKNQSLFSKLKQGKGRENIDRIRCERNVYTCLQNSPILKLMLGALKSSGCTVDIRRHIACEECSPTVSGGYDPVLNQIVVCHNICSSKNIITGVLTHEMIHMFDYCRNNLDFKNVDHLACTEIRAANLTHCSFLSAWLQGTASIFNIKATHRNCVKERALISVLHARNVSVEVAQEAVDRVFDRCYADLEPFGRRIKRNSLDMFKAYNEGFLYGYDADGNI